MRASLEAAAAACEHQHPSGFTPKQTLRSSSRRGAAERVEFLRLKRTRRLYRPCVRVLSARRAAASNRLRDLMWERQFGKGREAERERRGGAQILHFCL